MDLANSQHWDLLQRGTKKLLILLRKSFDLLTAIIEGLYWEIIITYIQLI